MVAVQPPPDRDDLVGVLEQLVALLRRHGADDRALALDADRRLVAEGHPDALGRLIASYHGPDGLAAFEFDGDDPGVRRANDRLRTLRAAALTMATALRRTDEPEE